MISAVTCNTCTLVTVAVVHVTADVVCSRCTCTIEYYYVIVLIVIPYIIYNNVYNIYCLVHVHVLQILFLFFCFASLLVKKKKTTCMCTVYIMVQSLV